MSPVAKAQEPIAVDNDSGIGRSAPTKWECFAAAVQFLTRIPVPGMRLMSPDDYTIALRGGVLFFPLVGGLIGVFTSAIFLCGLFGLSPWVAALIAIGCEALLTGAFHEDAFADTCDALGGGWTRDQVLDILKDSRLGTYGTLALGIGVGLRVACVASLADEGWAWAVASIIASSTLGRLAIVAMMATTQPVAHRASRARDVAGAQDGRTLVIATLISLPLWGCWFWLGTMQAILGVVMVIALLAWYRHRMMQRVGGTTGDLLGCGAFLTQLAILVASSWRSAG